MKKINKNLAVVTLSVAMAASSLTGCSLSSSSNTSNVSSADTVTKTENDAESPEADNSGDSSEVGYVGPETDTVQWFNATYAILTYANGQDYNLFGGANPSAIMEAQYQAVLDSSWGVTDRESADETLDWILTEGHRSYFKEDGELFAQYGLDEVEEEDHVNFLMEAYECSQEDAEYVAAIYKMYKEYGETAIDGWDYCRALSLMSFYYMAGYYTKEEALDKSLEIAQTVQPLFGSWDELVDSYLRGYEYWAESDSSDRREIYDELVAADDNPFRVDYNITLEKTW